MLRTIGRAVAALVLSLAFAGCSDDNNSNDNGLQDGTMSMMITDAPGDVVHAVVTIEQIYLQASEDSTEGGERVVLRSEPYTTDLMTLQNDVDSLFTNVTVPGGDYEQLRFVISGGYVEVEQDSGGTTKVYASSPTYAGLPAGTVVDGELQMPSFGTSGLKVTVPGSVLHVDGDNVVLLVDFDVSQSFGHAAGADKWVMHPVVTAIDFTAAGSVQGTVTFDSTVVFPDTLVLPGIGIQLGSETHTLVVANRSATYSFANVLPGTYQLKLVPLGGASVFVTDPVSPVTVTVTEGGAITTDLKVTAIN